MARKKNEVFEAWQKENMLQSRQLMKTPPKLQALKRDLLDPSKRLIFIVGLPSTGKTKCTIELGVEQVLAGKYGKLVLIRPILIPEFGYLPGDAESKMAYYLRQAKVYVDGSTLEGFRKLVEADKIEILPADQLQGSRFFDCFVVADEFQNIPEEYAFKFLSRVGEGCKFAVIGDISRGQANKKIRQGATLLDYGLSKFAEKAYASCHRFYDEEDILGDPETIDIIKTMLPDFV